MSKIKTDPNEVKQFILVTAEKNNYVCILHPDTAAELRKELSVQIIGEDSVGRHSRHRLVSE